ncbi:ergothioneine biosynthesis protein EgtC [Sodalinema gerasimenkoae]|uniref:ergothioneine biosynthesis protein EgtC n=1 Tax=Sodalinema gerasimenkoae TaxID=2862348 RepID=UPI00135BFA4F|nr:ergothioneine biosynthesis protein EgtC [Sodalinema gerasimenkoae]MCC5897754.1 ergothioneine biosynthesis protein EgtC [Phormidium sp. BM_Day4_Bin.17]TVR12651.1 MAG: ergothioneine biosynthesis protein EgtC [Phormidium sp. GEM2.Bin31]UCJ12602.1 MAG: ergothioneine biosynthesis protein EgtC [Phormidium sp. PBR-2020]
MCRLLAYLGSPVSLHSLLCQPPHSLVVQSYQPQEMTAGLLNADGYGFSWYDRRQQDQPFIYKSLLPIWSDINLSSLSHYIHSDCILAYVRSATPGQALDLSNGQPFSHDNWSFIHNGAIPQFRQRLYRPLRDRLRSPYYELINGSTDSEHLFAYLMQLQDETPQQPLSQTLKTALKDFQELAMAHNSQLSANLVLSDGQHLIACRFAVNTAPPSLYYLQQDGSHLIASEPIFPGNWQAFAPSSILTINPNQGPQWTVLNP